MKILITTLLLACTAAVSANDTVTLYQLTGAIQCGDTGGITMEKAADLLRAQGVRVVSTERRQLPIAIPVHCGVPTGEANLIQVSTLDWATFSAKTPDAGGYGIWIYDQETVQIFQYDGTLQCGTGQAIAPETTAEVLASVGIHVISSRKGTDGLSHIAICGAATGSINVHAIPTESLPAARQLGFQVLVTRDMAQQIKPRTQSIRITGMHARSMPRPKAQQDAIPLLW